MASLAPLITACAQRRALSTPSRFKPALHRGTHLPATCGKPRVTTNPAVDIQVTLAVPAQVDGAWRDVDVHQVIHNAALDMVQDPVHQVPPAHVHDLDVGQLSAKGEARYK